MPPVAYMPPQWKYATSEKICHLRLNIPTGYISNFIAWYRQQVCSQGCYRLWITSKVSDKWRHFYILVYNVGGLYATSPGELSAGGIYATWVRSLLPGWTASLARFLVTIVRRRSGCLPLYINRLNNVTSPLKHIVLRRWHICHLSTAGGLFTNREKEPTVRLNWVCRKNSCNDYTTEVPISSSVRQQVE